MTDPDAVEALRTEFAEWKAAERDRELAAQAARYAPPERVAPEHVREAEGRRVREAADRHEALREQDRRRDDHLVAVAPERAALLAEIAGLAEREDAERARYAAQMAEIGQERLRLSRELARVETVPVETPAAAPGQRLRALVGGRSS